MPAVGKSRPFPADSRAFMRLAAMASDMPLLFVPIGDNPARPFGMDARGRACRLATNAGLECADAPQRDRAALLASMAYGWDPAWLKEMRERPRAVLTLGGRPVMAHVPEGEDAAAVAAAIEGGRPIDGFEHVSAETASSPIPRCGSVSGHSCCRSIRQTRSQWSAPRTMRPTRALPTR